MVCLSKKPQGHLGDFLLSFFLPDVVVMSPSYWLSSPKKSELLTLNAEFSYNLEKEL